VKIDVVVPTYNRADLLRGCLEHLARQDVAHTAIVVDNGSDDGTVAMLRADFPDVRVVALEENLGFGRAVDRGVAAADGDVVVLINNDVDVGDGFLRELVAPLAADPRAGMAAGVLLRTDGEHVDAAGIVIDGGLGGYGYLIGDPVARLDDPPGGLMGACGGAAAYRRTAYDAVGGFDDEIFAYSEDLDLALRLLAAGWTCAFAPGARGLHLGSATLGLRSVRQVRISAYSRGYILGRYRVGPRWLATEALVALADAALLRSPAPLTQRVHGLRRGRALPARVTPRVPTLRWRAALRRRFRAAA
jgi:N-acetylglucosaminyl-diphospho-decaprenol L-rhamnosyltransferase